MSRKFQVAVTGKDFAPALLFDHNGGSVARRLTIMRLVVLRRDVSAAVCGTAAFIALIVSAGALDAQEGFRFRTGVELINVTATVTDSSGRFVPGLKQTDFIVYEDDQPVDITHFNASVVNFT